jgi:hypothetical protein
MGWLLWARFVLLAALAGVAAGCVWAGSARSTKAR